MTEGSKNTFNIAPICSSRILPYTINHSIQYNTIQYIKQLYNNIVITPYDASRRFYSIIQ